MAWAAWVVPPGMPTSLCRLPCYCSVSGGSKWGSTFAMDICQTTVHIHGLLIGNGLRCLLLNSWTHFWYTQVSPIVMSMDSVFNLIQQTPFHTAVK